MSASLVFYILLWNAAQQLSLVAGHGAVISLNDGGDVTGARNWLVHTGHVDGLHEWDPYSLNGIQGRVDETSSPCGEPGQTQHGEQYRDLRPQFLARGLLTPGQEVKFEVRVTANHGGWMQYRWSCVTGGTGVVAMEDFYDIDATISTEEKCHTMYPGANFKSNTCMAPRLLKRVHKGETKNFWAAYPNNYILSQEEACQENVGEENTFAMYYQLPQRECQRIVIQWWWTTSNSCIIPEWRQPDFPCKGQRPTSCLHL